MASTHYYRPTKAIIDVGAIKENIKALRNYLREETAIIAVVKADGYGHGIVEIARAALQSGAAMVSVATPDEAVYLRENGITSEILVMATSPVSFAKKAAELGVAVTVTDEAWLREIQHEQKSFNEKLKIHVKIDCGMGRIGVRDEQELQTIMQLIEKMTHCELDGVFTHFPCADEECSITTKEQSERFVRFVNLFPKKPRIVHASNSAATLLYPEYGFDAVRFGISMYGIAPSDYVQENLPFQLKKSLSIESELSFVKKLAKDYHIGYGATYKTSSEEWIGTIPMGYADGLKRGLRGQEVLINGKRMPIVGTICMDQCMVKLPEEMPVGEKVVFIGKQGDEEITIEEWADRIGTIPYEIAVSFTSRVPRVYQEED